MSVHLLANLVIKEDFLSKLHHIPLQHIWALTTDLLKQACSACYLHPTVKCKGGLLLRFIWGERIRGFASLFSFWGSRQHQPGASQNTMPCSYIEQRAFMVCFSPQGGHTFYEPGLPQFTTTGGGPFSLLLFFAWTYPSGLELSFSG